jgi:hypothetical protein
VVPGDLSDGRPEERKEVPTRKRRFACPVILVKTAAATRGHGGKEAASAC